MTRREEEHFERQSVEIERAVHGFTTDWHNRNRLV